MYMCLRWCVYMILLMNFHSQLPIINIGMFYKAKWGHFLSISVKVLLVTFFNLCRYRSVIWNCIYICSFKINGSFKSATYVQPGHWKRKPCNLQTFPAFPCFHPCTPWHPPAPEAHVNYWQLKFTFLTHYPWNWQLQWSISRVGWMFITYSVVSRLNVLKTVCTFVFPACTHSTRHIDNRRLLFPIFPTGILSKQFPLLI